MKVIYFRQITVKKSKFWLKMQISVKNFKKFLEGHPNFEKTFKFPSKIQILIKIQLLVKIQILVKNPNLGKNPNLSKKSKFW